MNIYGYCPQEIIYESSIEALKETFHRVELVFNTDQESPPQIQYCSEWQGARKLWSTVYHGSLENLKEDLKQHEGNIQKRMPLTLTDAFISMVSQNGSTLGKSSKEEKTQKLISQGLET